jgi:hypothetical protein
MSNRIAQFWSSIEHLFQAASATANNESGRLASSPFTPGSPLEVYVDRKYVKVVVEVSIRQMRRHLKTGGLTDDVRQQLETEVARRKQFLVWLDQDQSKAQVYMAMHPAAEWPAAPAPVSEQEPDRDW